MVKARSHLLTHGSDQRGKPLLASRAVQRSVRGAAALRTRRLYRLLMGTSLLRGRFVGGASVHATACVAIAGVQVCVRA